MSHHSFFAGFFFFVFSKSNLIWFWTPLLRSPLEIHVTVTILLFLSPCPPTRPSLWSSQGSTEHIWECPLMPTSRWLLYMSSSVCDFLSRPGRGNSSQLLIQTPCSHSPNPLPYPSRVMKVCASLCLLPTSEKSVSLYSPSSSFISVSYPYAPSQPHSCQASYSSSLSLDF